MAGSRQVEVVGGPLDGSKMPLSQETKYGFQYTIERAVYHYDYKQTDPKDGFVVKGRFVFREVTDGKQPPEGQKGRT
jgi:hypothetical protein